MHKQNKTARVLLTTAGDLIEFTTILNKMANFTRITYFYFFTRILLELPAHWKYRFIVLIRHRHSMFKPPPFDVYATLIGCIRHLIGRIRHPIGRIRHPLGMHAPPPLDVYATPFGCMRHPIGCIRHPHWMCTPPTDLFAELVF